MTVYPGARYRPLPKFSNGLTYPHTGVAFHVNDSNGPSLYNWIAGNNNMSCHFQIAKSGVVEQYLDTNLGSWCQMDGNNSYISVETEGYPSEYLTEAQVTAFGKLMAWIHKVHGIPLVSTDTVGHAGLILHGDGGAAWGGHTGCPGAKRASQRAAILKIAGATTPTGPHLRYYWPSWMPAGEYFGWIHGPDASHGGINATEQHDIKVIQDRLRALGYYKGGDTYGIFGGYTRDAVTRWQRAKVFGTTRYGEVWSDDWRKLFTY